MTRSEMQSELAYLKRRCQTHRQHGLSGHFAYSLPRHWADLRRYEALKAELEKVDGDKP